MRYFHSLKVSCQLRSLLLLNRNICIKGDTGVKFVSCKRTYSSKVPGKALYDVNPFGSFSSGPTSGSFHVTNLNPQEYVEQDKVFLSGDEGDIADCVTQEGSNLNVEGHKGLCHATVPLKFNIDLTVLGTSNVHVENLENEKTVVQLEEGSCALGKLMSEQLHVQTVNGPVTSRSSIQADTRISSVGGSIDLHKMLGQALTVQTETGPVHIHNLYSLSSLITTHSGHVHINNCHRETQVKILKQGNLVIGSLDGSLDAEIANGNVQLLLANHQLVNINVTRGDIEIQVPESLTTHLELTATHVDLPQSLTTNQMTTHTEGSLTTVKGVVEGTPEVSSRRGVHQRKNADRDEILASKPRLLKAHAKGGTVRLTVSDWVSSLKLAEKYGLGE